MLPSPGWLWAVCDHPCDYAQALRATGSDLGQAPFAPSRALVCDSRSARAGAVGCGLAQAKRFGTRHREALQDRRGGRLLEGVRVRCPAWQVDAACFDVGNVGTRRSDGRVRRACSCVSGGGRVKSGATRGSIRVAQDARPACGLFPLCTRRSRLPRRPDLRSMLR